MTVKEYNRKIVVVWLGMVLSLCRIDCVRASIIYFDLSDLFISSPCGNPTPLDIDGDTLTEIVFSADAVLSLGLGEPDYEYLFSDPLGLNRVVGRAVTAFTIEHFVLVPMGFLIGSDLTNSLEWIVGDPNVGDQIRTHVGIFDESIVPCGSDFAGTNGFIGLEFDIAGQTHYGWIRITPYDITGAAILRDYAYETTPGVGILAGQIPEPSTILLLSLGALGLLWRGAKRLRHRQ